MSDIVKRLRYMHEHGLMSAAYAGIHVSYSKAADRIEALETALKGMSEKIAVESRDLRAHGEYRRGLAVAASMVDLHARAALGE